ncbi:hypothetical protein [Tessaracoccus lacteus]|uniref:Site-specific DNA-methyltransferase (adenine-specific) n=1 Tax=Tessaracoccus lacteus TaxID=3041766 RepID=A0ABY8PY10_9ACTN|nr:hypothetical protein [Tessaracoccus sp. T21]WGT47292.1 hypothetical protein QH948_00455 [Tessaracoccus sp. T21]
MAESEIDRKLAGRWNKTGFVGWRDVCRATDARTVITTMVPASQGYGHKWMLALPSTGDRLLQAYWSSFALDYVARQKLGGTSMSFGTISQQPIPAPSDVMGEQVPLDRPLASWIDLRVDRLNGWIADPDERARVRAELDALMFHIYGLGRNDVSYVLDTFPIVKRKDEAAFGSYRTKELILAAYDALAEAEASGTPYCAPWNQEVHP